jgi:hypothetical protein
MAPPVTLSVPVVIPPAIRLPKEALLETIEEAFKSPDTERPPYNTIDPELNCEVDEGVVSNTTKD